MISEKRGIITNEERSTIKEEMLQLSLRVWKRRIITRDHASGEQLRQAIIPIFDTWMNRRTGSFTYEMTQLLTGHGSLNLYLWRFKKIDSPRCIYCRAAYDDNIYVFASCPKWREERITLRAKLCISDVSLRNILKSVAQCDRKWSALKDFCYKIIRQKIKDE